jgi:hypothetical protein
VPVHLGAGADLREHLAGDLELVEQLGVPVEGGEVHQQRAAGVGHVGEVPAGEVPDQPGVHGAGEDLAPLGTPAQAVDLVQQPAQLGAGEVGGQRQAGPAAEEVFVRAQGVEDRAGTGVLPDDRVVHRAAGVPLPDDRGLALVGDPDGGEVAPLGGLGDDPPDVGPDLLGVVLDPARPGEDLAVLPLGDRHDLAAGVEDDAARRGGALIDRGDVALLHARTVALR